MEISIFLAKVIGVIGTLSVLPIIFRYQQSVTLDERMVKNKIFNYLSGFSMIILGTLIVINHSVWTFDWRIVITLIGWALLLKGIGRIFFTEAVIAMLKKKRENTRFIFGEVLFLLVSLYLLYHGFIAR